MITSAITVYNSSKKKLKIVKYKNLDTNFLKCINLMLLRNISLDEIGFDNISILETYSGFKFLYKDEIVKEYFIFNTQEKSWESNLMLKIKKNYPEKFNKVNWKIFLEHSKFLNVNFFLLDIISYNNQSILNILEEYLIYLYFNKLEN